MVSGVQTDGLVDNDLRPRILHLLDYLDAVRALREVPIRDVENYDDALWWVGRLPDHPSIRLGNLPDNAWLRIQKVEVPPPPDVLPELVEYIETADAISAIIEPSLPEDLDQRFDHDVDRYVELVDTFETWRDAHWRPWAADAGPAYAAP